MVLRGLVLEASPIVGFQVPWQCLSIFIEANCFSTDRKVVPDLATEPKSTDSHFGNLVSPSELVSILRLVTMQPVLQTPVHLA